MDVRQKQMVVLMLAAAVIAGIGFWSVWQKNSLEDRALPPAPPAKTSEAASPGGEAYAYISGAVNRPGVYKTVSGSRVIDLVNTAGGLAAGADVAHVNLAQPVKDGLHVYIPVSPEKQAAAGNTTNTVNTAKPGNAGDKINLNTADKAQLEKLPGIGPALAERILEYRQTNGSFQELEDIKKVSGIGEAKFKQIKDKLAI